MSSVCLCVCVLVLDLFQDDLWCLFSPHQVNHDGVQNAPSQVILYKSHTTEESVKRRRSCRYCIASAFRALFSPVSLPAGLFLHQEGEARESIAFFFFFLKKTK